MSKRVHSNVETLLKYGYKTATPQQLRDSDKTLILAYLEMVDGLELTPEQKAKFMQSTTFESITRARRALKADYPASQKVDEQRYQQFKEYKQTYSPQYQGALV